MECKSFDLAAKLDWLVINRCANTHPSIHVLIHILYLSCGKLQNVFDEVVMPRDINRGVRRIVSSSSESDTSRSGGRSYRSRSGQSSSSSSRSRRARTPRRGTRSLPHPLRARSLSPRARLERLTVGDQGPEVHTRPAGEPQVPPVQQIEGEGNNQIEIFQRMLSRQQE